MYILGFFLGAVLGSLVKALADRSLIKRSFWGRSYCPKCKHILAWYDLLPIISYFQLGGKCRHCQRKISIEYLVVEVIMGLLVGLLFYLSLPGVIARSPDFIGTTWQSIFLNFQFIQVIFDLIFKTFFITVLAVLFLTDIKKMFIPDRIIIPAIWVSIIFITFITVIKIIYLYYSLNQTRVGQLLLPPHSDYFQRHALISAQPLFGSLAMGFLIGAFFLTLIIITKGKGMGGGDVKLGAFLGLVLGFPNALVALMLAFLSGAIVSVVLILFGKKHFGETIPFGPFLVLGSLAALFWGSRIIDWYLQLSSFKLGY